MKNIFATIFLLAISFSDLLGQSNTYGIFKTAEEYNNNKLSLVLQSDSPKTKIKLHHFFGKNYIDVIQNDKQIRFIKDSIFGYRDSKQNDFRFYRSNEKEYQILENKTITIYKTLIPITATTGKTISLVPAYFFSTTLSGDIFRLTILNLKKALPDNLKFHDQLDIQFGDGTSLSTYNTEHKMYQVNFLLTKSIHN